MSVPVVDERLVSVDPFTNARTVGRSEEMKEYSDTDESGTDSEEEEDDYDEEEEQEDYTSSRAKSDPTRSSSKNVASRSTANSANTQPKAKTNGTPARNPTPAVKSQANGGPKRAPTNASTKMTSNGKALSPYADRASAPSPAITNKSSAVMSHTHIDIDTNVLPEDDRTFKRTVNLVWSGRDAKDVILDSGKLKSLFTVEVMDPDKSMETKQYYAPRNLKDFFLKKVSLVGTSNSTTQIITASIRSGKEEMSAELDYLNSQKTFSSSGESYEASMFAVPPGTVVYGKCGRVLVDNVKFMSSKAFLNFGHVDQERIEKLIVVPSNVDVDQRLRYPASSPIGLIILREENRSDLERYFEEGSSARAELSDEERLLEGKIEQIGEHIHIGPRTLARAIAQFDKKVRPMIRGKHDLIKHDQLIFHIHSTGRPLQEHTVQATLEFTYAFSRGTRDIIEEIRVKKEKERVNPMNIFASALQGQITRSATKLTTARKQ